MQQFFVYSTAGFISAPQPRLIGKGDVGNYAMEDHCNSLLFATCRRVSAEIILIDSKQGAEGALRMGMVSVLGGRLKVDV